MPKQMSLSEALKIKRDWDANYFDGRPRTLSIKRAEDVILKYTDKPVSEWERLRRKMALSANKVENMIRETEQDSDLNTSEKAYVLNLLTDVKSFYVRYKKRLK